MERAWLKANAAVCALVLLALLLDRRPLPAAHRPPAEVRRLLAQEAAEDDLLDWRGFSRESLL